MTHLQVDPPSYLKTPPPGGTLPALRIATPLAADVDLISHQHVCAGTTTTRPNATAARIATPLLPDSHGDTVRRRCDTANHP